mmetsp:Transcript_15058/g.38845  ORF Transcript_15058/g.38845 Transcript_15058/m.38845 type:complete len:363 (+) Transcript_15058:245-1333(+)
MSMHLTHLALIIVTCGTWVCDHVYTCRRAHVVLAIQFTSTSSSDHMIIRSQTVARQHNDMLMPCDPERHSAAGLRDSRTAFRGINHVACLVSRQVRPRIEHARSGVLERVSHLTTLAPVHADVLSSESLRPPTASASEPRIFQKRRVSSAAAETTVDPSGLCAMWSTRAVWPVSSAALTIEGYFHRMSWLCEKPCDETSSWSCTDQSSAQTCECVSTALITWPVCMDQKRMQRSAVPPPLASTFFCHGHHASALTAALWAFSLYSRDGSRRSSHMFSRLSLPPEASCVPLGAHLRPHTSCEWPWSVAISGEAARRSRCTMVASREPDDSCCPEDSLLHARLATRPQWPSNLRNIRPLAVSQI